MTNETRELNAHVVQLISDLLEKHADAILEEVQARYSIKDAEMKALRREIEAYNWGAMHAFRAEQQSDPASGKGAKDDQPAA